MRSQILLATLLEERDSLFAAWKKARLYVTDIEHRVIIGAGKAALEDRKFAAMTSELKSLDRYIYACKVCDNLGV